MIKEQPAPPSKWTKRVKNTEDASATHAATDHNVQNRSDWWTDGELAGGSAPTNATISQIAERIEQQNSTARPLAPAPVPPPPIDLSEAVPSRPDLRPRPLNEHQKRVAELSDS